MEAIQTWRAHVKTKDHLTKMMAIFIEAFTKLDEGPLLEAIVFAVNQKIEKANRTNVAAMIPGIKTIKGIKQKLHWLDKISTGSLGQVRREHARVLFEAYWIEPNELAIRLVDEIFSGGGESSQKWVKLRYVLVGQYNPYALSRSDHSYAGNASFGVPNSERKDVPGSGSGFGVPNSERKDEINEPEPDPWAAKGADMSGTPMSLKGKGTQKVLGKKDGYAQQELAGPKEDEPTRQGIELIMEKLGNTQ